jgi:hypothetical protein
MSSENRTHELDLYEPIITPLSIRESGQMNLADLRRQMIESGEVGHSVVAHSVQLDNNED